MLHLGTRHKWHPYKIAKNWPPLSLPLWLNPLSPLLVCGDTPKVSKNRSFFAPKSADVRVWRPPLLVRKTSALDKLPDCGWFLWTAPCIKQTYCTLGGEIIISMVQWRACSMFIYSPIYLDQETAKGPFSYSGRGIPLSVLPKDTRIELAGFFSTQHYMNPFRTERQQNAVNTNLLFKSFGAT